jgi:hypothetical protein
VDRTVKQRSQIVSSGLQDGQTGLGAPRAAESATRVYEVDPIGWTGIGVT